MVFLQFVEHLGEVEKRTRKAVDLVADYHVYFVRPDIIHQSLKRGALQIAAGVPTVIVARLKTHPAFKTFRRNVRFAGHPLGVEGVELLFKTFFHALSRVDRASRHLLHGAPPSLKNLRPE